MRYWFRCLCLGLVLLAGSRVDAQDKKAVDQATAALKKLGGMVEVDEKDTTKPVVTIYLNITKITDNDLAQLKAFTKLRKLCLPGTKISNAGLAHLKGLTSLKELYLADTPINDAGLVHLKGLVNLETLSLSLTDVSDKGLADLKGFKNLKDLYLLGTKVTDAGVKEFQKAFPKLKILR